MTFRCVPTCILLAVLVGLPAQAGQVSFTPESGLSGPSHGDGSLRLFFGHPRVFHVRSVGKSESDGSFTLNQVVTFDGQDAQVRSWTIRHVSPLRFAGTLSDAAGAVSGQTSGPTLSLQYRVKGPFVMHQVLRLMPDGKTIDNVGRVTLLGIPVGFLHETIRRGD